MYVFPPNNAEGDVTNKNGDGYKLALTSHATSVASEFHPENNNILLILLLTTQHAQR